MENRKRIRDLTQGDYTVTYYEQNKSKYNEGFSFRINIVDKNNEEIKIWSNSYLSDYIALKKPTKKFTITIDSEGKVVIPGFSRGVYLF